jgi:hypothetical protein
MQRRPWLLLLYGLPAQAKAERISLWRKLKKLGAIQFKTSAYILPDEPVHLERFQWLAKQVRDGGGEATLMQVAKIEGVTDEEIIAKFNQERSDEYLEVIEQIKAATLGRKRKLMPEQLSAVERIRRRYQEIQAIDYFSSPAAHDAEMALKRTERIDAPAGKVRREDFQKRQWLTRPRPEIDRVGSAWLIKRFIDPEARFVFSKEPGEYPEAVPYDMNDVEFTHHGEDCTFETLIKRFKLGDKRLQAMGEMIHDADLEDGKFQRSECVGIDRVLKGYGNMGLPDEEILKRGFECFDGLYASQRKS